MQDDLNLARAITRSMNGGVAIPPDRMLEIAEHTAGLAEALAEMVPVPKGPAA